MRLRGGRDALCDLPDGVLFRRKARNERRGNVWNQSLKEFFLIIKGDPTTSARWLARQIDDLADRVPRGDVRRQRVGARFDTNQGPVLVPLEHEEEQEQEQEQEEEEEDKEQAEQQQEADTGSTYAQFNLIAITATSTTDLLLEPATTTILHNKLLLRNKLKQQRRGQTRQKTPQTRFKCSPRTVLAKTHQPATDPSARGLHCRTRQRKC